MLTALALGLQDHGFAVVMLDAEVVIAVPIRSSRCCGAVAKPGEEHLSTGSSDVIVAEGATDQQGW